MPTRPLDQRHVLLIHPLGYQASAAQHDISRKANLMPPLGLASLAAYVERQGMTAGIIDCFARPGSDGEIAAYLREYRPAFLGLTTTTSSFYDAARIAALAKAELPDITTLVGGPHVSAIRERALELAPAIDVVIAGEGERPLISIMEREGRDWADVPGLVYREGGEIVSTGLQGRGIELDELPFPAYEKLVGYPHLYRLPIFNYPRTPNTSCISSRGCPYACSYCDRSVFRRSFRYNSADYLYQHLAYLKERWRIRHINFYDDQFTFNRERVEAFCRLMIDKPLGMTFNCAVRAEHVDANLLQLMKAAGCWMISLGIETGDPELLAQHRQNADLQMLAERIHDIHRAGIRTKGLLMLGLPGETEQTVKNSMDYVFSLPIDDFNLAKFTPFPGSPIYEGIHELGEFDEDWNKLDCMHLQFVPHGMTRARLDELFTAFYRAHFMRPRTQWGYVKMLWKSPDSWRRFIGNLGGFLSFAFSNKRMGDA